MQADFIFMFAYRVFVGVVCICVGIPVAINGQKEEVYQQNPSLCCCFCFLPVLVVDNVFDEIMLLMKAYKQTIIIHAFLMRRIPL